ncbi:MAG TPA: glucosamine-6-phosphate deaminase [Chthonomonadaceae bacterium]|nr:glucosamine-6-phosphate deaminase [Chthonomonadaceae bacterium]
MDIVISETKQALGRRAAVAGAVAIRRTIREQGAANIILATGASQFDMLAELVQEEIDWSVVTAFHLDEYAAMPVSHPASFRRYLKERFVDRLPQPLRAFHWIDGEGDLAAECRRLGEIIARHPIAVAFIGIGENGHLAFNDPPADFETEAPYIVVTLEEACRRQQLGEGWFATLDDVPRQAISMSIRQILKSGRVVCTVPDRRKAQAVQAAVEGPITPMVPASILRQHPRTTLFLDRDSASLLEHRPSSDP